MNIENDPRILSWDNLIERINLNHSFQQIVPGDPRCVLIYDSQATSLELQIKNLDGQQPTVEPLKIEISSLQINEVEYLSLKINDAEIFREFYDLVVEIVDSVQILQIKPHLAIDKAWKTWTLLLNQGNILSKEKQLGLMGELWLLQRVAQHRGWRVALDSWHSDARAEHDFSFDTYDIEVKTTSSEDRIHVIGSVNQLMPAAGRDLLLLSLQFTGAPFLLKNSFSLSTLVQDILENLKKEGLVDNFKSRLEMAGWNPSHSRHYSTKFISRSEAVLIRVDDSCPKITPPVLREIANLQYDRLVAVSYRINVNGLGFADGTDDFHHYLP